MAIPKFITLKGAQAGVSGNDASRGSGESVLVGSSGQTQGAFVITTTSPVTINGFTFNGSRIIDGRTEPERF